MIIDVVAWVFAHWYEVVAQLVAVLMALIALFTLIPGPSPERELQAVLDFLKKFSRK
jgi:hypothetical protein